MTTIHTLDRLEALPSPAPDGDIIVVDVIMASTAIVSLFEQGVTSITPFADSDAARDFAASRDDVILVGEDGGAPIDGFDYVPLPGTFAEADLDGRPVALRSSNGTRGIIRSGVTDNLFIGTTVNAQAVASVLESRGNDRWLVAAGRQGSPVAEDSAGVRLIEGHLREDLKPGEREVLKEQIRNSVTADWLRSIGLEDDLEALLEFDTSDIVPVLRDGTLYPVSV